MKQTGKTPATIVSTLPTANNVAGDQVVWNNIKYVYTATGWTPLQTWSTNILYKKTQWANLNDFTLSGTIAPTIVNGFIRMAGGTTNFQSFMTLNGFTNNDPNIDIEVTIKWNTVGIAQIGKASINPNQNLSMCFWDNVSGGPQLNIFPCVAATSFGGGILATGSYTPADAVGDIVRLKYSQRGDTVTAIKHNVSSNFKTSLSFKVGMASNPNASNICFWLGLQSWDIIGIEVSTRTMINPYILCIGDSKTEGNSANSHAMAFANNIVQLGPTVNFGGSSDTTKEALACIPYAIKINPQYVLLCIGRNDLGFSIATATWQANYTSIVSQLQTAGIKVIHLIPIPETTISQTTLDSWIRTTYPGQFIDSTVGWVNSVHLYGDGTHPNPLGHAFLADKIVNSGLIPYSGHSFRVNDPYDALVTGYPLF